jgi:uncharacterized protein (DUF1697 family)
VAEGKETDHLHGDDVRGVRIRSSRSRAWFALLSVRPTTFECMTTYVVLLRGINLGKNKRIKMGDLRDALTAVGLENAQTLIQSGNVVVDSNADKAALVDIVETTIESTFGFRSTVIARTAAEFRSLLADHPFTSEQIEDSRFVHVEFCRDKPDRDGFDALQEGHEGPEELKLVGRELYVYYPEGSGRSKLTNSVFEKHLGTPTTSRNWNTIEKIAAILDER